MSIASIDQRPTPSPAKPLTARSWLTVLARMARRLIVRIIERRRARRDAWALLAMDDRMLADIGLHRCEVEFVVRHGARREQDGVSGDR